MSYDEEAAMSGLASDIDALQQQLHQLEQQVAHLTTPTNEATNGETDTSSGCGDGQSGQPAEEESTPPTPSWYNLRGKPFAQRHLPRLTTWVDTVYLAYPDASLPECWAWHSTAVEELTWLWYAWQAAYLDPAKDWNPRPAEWHSRYRPGVVARLQDLADCSLLRHRQHRHSGPTPVPLPDAAADVALWWATTPHDRGELPPTDAHLDQADAYIQKEGAS